MINLNKKKSSKKICFIYSCGDGSLGEASQPIQCKNMQFLLKKHKKVTIHISSIFLIYDRFLIYSSFFLLFTRFSLQCLVFMDGVHSHG